MPTTILVLVDNTSYSSLRSEWGWSVYISSPSWRIIFDADTDPSILEYNMSILNVGVNDIDFGILSHHHRDHSGGFRLLGSRRRRFKVYVPPGSLEYLLEWGLDVVTVREPLEVASNLWIIGPLKSGILAGLTELAIAVETSKGVIVVTGCSHPGLDKIVGKALETIGVDEAYMVIGGFHNASRKAIDRVASKCTYLAPGHCTPDKVKEYIKKRYMEKYVPVYAGLKIVV